MTTPEAAERYLAQHVASYAGMPYAVFNPNDRPVGDLPIIYGWNNGGSDQWYRGHLMAEDGTALGGHVCSAEGYMYTDLGILEGSAPDRHEHFRKHYPDGYRMDFVPYADARAHRGLMAAYEKNQEKGRAAKAEAEATAHHGLTVADAIAKGSYEVADAMIKAREAGQ